MLASSGVEGPRFDKRIVYSVGDGPRPNQTRIREDIGFVRDSSTGQNEFLEDIMDVTVEIRRCCSIIDEANVSGTLDSASSRRALSDLLQLAQRRFLHTSSHFQKECDPVRHSWTSPGSLLRHSMPVRTCIYACVLRST